MKYPFSLSLLLLSVTTFGLGSIVHAEKARPSATPAAPAAVAAPATPAATPPPQPPPPPAPSSDGVNPAVATIDMKKIFDSHPKTKDAASKVNAERDVAKKELDARMAKRNQMFEEITKLDRTLAGTKLAVSTKGETDWMRNAKVTALQKMDDQIREYQAVHDKALQEMAAKLRDPIVGEISKAIAAAPPLNAFSFLLDRTGATKNGSHFVLHSSPRLDQSAGVQQQLGVEGAAESADAPAGPELNLATLDMKKIFAGYYKTKEAEDAISANKAESKKDIDNRTATFTAAQQTLKALQTELADPALSNNLRKTKAKSQVTQMAALDKMEKEIKARQITHEGENQHLSTGLKAEIVDDINKAVQEAVQAEGHIDLLLDAGGTGLSDTPAVLHREGIPDWTESILATLNDSKPGTKSAAHGRPNSTVSTKGLRFAIVDLKRVLEALANKKQGEIVEKVNKALTDQGSKAGYHLVFDSSAKSLSGVPFVIIRNQVPDLTEEMIKALGGTTP